MMATKLDLAEVLHEDGAIRYRYERYMSDEEGCWIRHGLFTAFHRNGGIASEGQYRHGAEEGTWRSYHENGNLAAKGKYHSGTESGLWRFWTSDGLLESEDKY